MIPQRVSLGDFYLTGRSRFLFDCYLTAQLYERCNPLKIGIFFI